MLINEVCRACNLTKKAIEYYGEQGLISPSVTENGYRRYSDDDVSKLKKIAVMRMLGLSVAEIRIVLEDDSPSTMLRILHKKELEITMLQERQELMKQLADDGDWETVREQTQALQNRQSILTRILDKFPGGYGQFVCFHFAPFLEEPIETKEQQDAFETIIGFLDHIAISIPQDLEEYLADAARNMNQAMLQSTSAALAEAMADPEKYIESNREMLKQVQAVMQSEDYKASPAYRLQEHLKQFQQQIGYQDVFIPALQRLSPSYRAYYESLQAANAVFVKHYPGYTS